MTNAQAYSGGSEARAPPRKMASSSLSDVGLGFAEYMTELGKLPDACLDLLSQDFSSGLALQSDSKLVFGYRIIAINDGSPVAKAASKEPIQPYEDLIVGLNGKPLDATKCKPNAGPLHSTVKDHEDKELTLTVFNCNSKRFREVKIVPTRKWAGTGLLGVVCRFDPVDPFAVLLPV